jgi:hypothetical protein
MNVMGADSSLSFDSASPKGCDMASHAPRMVLEVLGTETRARHLTPATEETNGRHMQH